MKVICIEYPKRKEKESIPVRVEVGATYDVIHTFNQNNLTYYELSIHPDHGYDVRLFIPCSDISETEFSRNYNTEKV